MYLKRYNIDQLAATFSSGGVTEYCLPLAPLTCTKRVFGYVWITIIHHQSHSLSSLRTQY